MHVLIEAIARLISGYLIKLIYGTDCKEKFIDIFVIGHAASSCYEFYISPEVSNQGYFEKFENLIEMKLKSI